MGEARVGKTLGNFRILECLGSGGSGMIWKAEDLSLGRVVALKALRAELATDAEMAQRFREEARTLARLSHPNVASVYSFLEDDDGLYLVLEYVEGSTLAAVLATTGPLPFEAAFALFHQVLDGVGHAHEAGVVHRDLKPSNLMVDASGRVKVMDFGIARVAGAARTTHHGKLVGTPEYMSPEQVRGEDATLRSDIYSLGIVLFEMLTGQPPFRSSASFELMRAQVEQQPPDPRTLRSELDARIAAAVLRALEKRPADRFASTRELQDALLAAGAARSARSAAALWRDLPRGGAASEAPTLANADVQALTPAPSTRPARTRETAADAVRPQPLTEPLDAWQQAVDALDDEIDASVAALSEEAPQRGLAPSTAVMDVTQETVQLDALRPTRMLEDGPFAAHAHSLAKQAAGDDSGAGARGRAIAAALAIALVALAVGIVQLRRSAHEAASSADGTVPSSDAAQSGPSATLPQAGAAARPETQPGASPRSSLASPSARGAPAERNPEVARQEESARRAPNKSAAKRAAAAVTQPARPQREQAVPATDDGWVIRR
jgi:serine/threonine-protein kinase